jgi:hypothetical protein
MGTALIVAGSALASAQSRDDDRRGDRRDGRVEQRDHDRGGDRDRGRHFEGRDRDDRGRFRDRDDFRFRARDDRRFVDRRYYYDRDYRYFVRNDYRYRIGERRFFNGYYWDWDGSRWCRRDHGVSVYFRF